MQTTSAADSAWWKESKLIPVIEPYVIILSNHIYPQFYNLKEKIGKGIEDSQSALDQFLGVG
jgi:hypothetical protein